MKRVILVVALVLAALLLAGVVGVRAWMDHPLGPPLVLHPPAASHLVETPRRGVSPGDVSPQGVSSLIPFLQKTCSGKGLIRLMVVGRASPNEAGRYGADAIRLAVVDFDREAAAILALPEKLWVDSPVLAEAGVNEASLNMVYQTAWETAHGNPDTVRTQKATQALAQTIVDNFAFVPDHYLTVEEAAFVRYVDTLGGIQITLGSDVDGTSEGYGLYPDGTYVIDGAHTLNFTRLIHPSGQVAPDTWGSLARQDLILKGLLDAALKPENWDKAPDLVKEIRQATTTDLSASQALDLACMAQAVGGSTRLLTVTPDMVTYDEGGNMRPDLQTIQQLIQSMESGL